MNWSGISNTSLIGQALRLPLKLVPATTVVPILQGKLKGKKWITGSSNHGCWLGSYEFDKQRLFETTIKLGSVVFDLGGHVGFYTLLAAELVGPKGKVVVFEPMPQNIQYIKEHIRLNQIQNVQLIEAAVSESNGIAFFQEGASTSMGRINAAGQLKIQTVTLDTLIANQELPRPDYLKIDIEGAELQALVGAQQMLAKDHPTIFLATHSLDLHRNCCQFLQSLGYMLKSIDDVDITHANEIIAYAQTYKN